MRKRPTPHPTVSFLTDTFDLGVLHSQTPAVHRQHTHTTLTKTGKIKCSTLQTHTLSAVSLAVRVLLAWQ